jgi:hypothetical protein
MYGGMMWWSGRNRRGLSYRVRRGRVINFELGRVGGSPKNMGV